MENANDVVVTPPVSAQSTIERAVAAMSGEKPAEAPIAPSATPEAVKTEPVAVDPKVAFEAERAAFLKEKEDFQKLQESTKQEVELTKQEKAYLESIRELPPAQRLAALEKYGFSPTDLAALIVDDAAKTPEQKAAEENAKELKAIKDRLAKDDETKAQAEARAKEETEKAKLTEYQNSLSGWSDNVVKKASAAPDGQYEMISMFPEWAANQAKLQIEAWFDDASAKGQATADKLPEVEKKILENIENYLFGLAKKAASAKKLGATGSKPSLSLVNGFGSTTKLNAPADRSKMTMEQRALLAMEGKLK